MPLDFDQVRTVFQDAVERDGADRAAFLTQACGGNDRLRAAVEALLASAETDDRFLEGPAFRDTAPPADSPGDRIGPYELVRPLGAGGMGAVWLATQQEPIARQVAIKLLRPEATDSLLARRLQGEAQTLARMEHPSIARVLDGGRLPDGRPFLVMEVVQGEPLNRYCQTRGLGLKERIALFRQVCLAVHHAHQKGVIHRDLKPSNVLVTEVDGKPLPKVIDFGIAKATGLPVVPGADLTEYGTVIGTLEYMSPEQADLSGRPVDTRTDVYALGVLLYELLTGTTPLDRAEVTGLTLVEVLRRIREVDPPPPSARVLSGGGGESVGGSTATGLSRAIRGELDWITSKALEKDPARRYESAAAVARDVERYLSNEPVEAGPPSAAYRLRTFIRRHRAGVAVTAVVGLAAAVAVAGVVVGLLRANDGRRAAETALTTADNQRRRAEAIAEFMQATLAGAKPAVARGRDTALLRDLLDAAVARLEAGELAADAEATADLRRTIGNTYGFLGQAGKAVTHLRLAAAATDAAFGGDDPRGTPHKLDLALWLFAAGEYRETEALADEVLRRCERLGLGAAPEAATAYGVRGDARFHLSGGVGTAAVEGHQRALAIRKAALPPSDMRIGRSLKDLAIAWNAQGNETEAVAVAREAVDFFRRYERSGPECVSSACILADALEENYRPGEVKALMLGTLTEAEAVFPPNHPDIADVLARLGSAQLRLDEDGDADRTLERCLAIRRAVYPGNHKDVAFALVNCGRVKMALGQLDKAEPLLREALAMRVALFGANTPVVASARADLGRCLRLANKLSDAEAELLLALKVLPDGSSLEVAEDAAGELALLYQSQRSFDKAVSYFGRNVTSRKRRLGQKHQAVADALSSLGAAQFLGGQKADAIKTLREAVEVARAAVGENHGITAYCLGNLAFVLEDAGDLDGAERACRDAVAGQKAATGVAHPEYGRHLDLLAGILKARKDPAAREPILRDLLAYREATDPTGWRTFGTRAELGGVLLERKRPAEAESLLLSGFAGLAAAKAAPRARPAAIAAANQLALLCDGDGRAADAANWRAKAAALTPEVAPAPRPIN